VTTIRKWTGRESHALREAMRLSQRQFADRLGVTGRAVSKWESGHVKNLRSDSQDILDTMLRQVSAEVRARFELILSGDTQTAEIDQDTAIPVREAPNGKRMCDGCGLPLSRYNLDSLCQSCLSTERKKESARRADPKTFPESVDIPNVGTGIASPEPRPDAIVLNLRRGGNDVIVPNDIMRRSRRAEWLTIASPAHLQEILIHLRDQWHALVKTDNLLGPRFALSDVLNQISVIEALRSILRDKQRIEVAQLGAKYAESAAWLYEEVGNMTQARFWASQAMEWAYEGDDERMLAWTIFRRAQQAAAVPDAAQAIGLAQAARRNEEKLATPTRAAIRVQEAYGYALDGNDRAAQRLIDEAHTWAASDTVGDAREGHGSYCTPDYIEIQRGHCWLASGQPKKAISVYEDSLRTLPTVYQRNRTATLSRLAAAYAADSQPEQAANTAYAALPAARNAGSGRIVGEIKNIGTALIPYRALPAVAALLDELEAEDKSPW
jgi:transcriptional regulator with XRE-family HTH domain/tetratricopeptide (TPR) repeat protein